MPTPEESRCPRCHAGPGTLTITPDGDLVARPLGDFSLSGSQIKFAARARPVLRCSACDLAVQGDWDDDQRHVTFTPPEPTP